MEFMNYIHLLCFNASYLEFHAWRIDEFIESPLKVKDGSTQAPEMPGHGIIFDFDKLTKFRIN